MPLDDNPFVQGMRRKTLDALRYADGGSVTDDDGMIQLGPKPGQFNQRTIFLGSQPGEFHESLPARHPATRWQRENAMRPPAIDLPETTYTPPPATPATDLFSPTNTTPAAPQHIAMPTTTGDSLYPQNLSPDWLNNATLNSLQQPFSMPVTGGSPMNLSDMVNIPQNKWEAGLLAAGVLPVGKILKGGSQALKLGTAALEGAEPEVGVLSSAISGGEEAGAAAPRQINRELSGMQQEQLDPRTLDKLEQAKAANPDFRAASDYLTPMEASKIVASRPNIDAFQTLLTELPNAAHMSALAKAGAPKRGWYRNSSQAILSIFGPQDAPRFAQLLAATSPQTSVESNLMNALNIWKNWTANGRPTDAASIKAIMGASVQGSKGEESVLDAWLNNSIRALSANDPRTVTLSGPKVDSFYHNLIDDVHRVTNDAWMANAFGVNQGLFAGSASEAQLLRGDPGLSPGYIATSARVRQGAQRAGMVPSEGQETIWSVAMPLYEEARKRGISPQEVLDKGLFTPDLVRGTPDFSTLFSQDPTLRNILEQSGYSQQLEGMKPLPFNNPAIPLNAAEQRYLDKTARTLGDLAELRGRESSSRSIPVPGQRPEYVYPSEQVEYIPGRATGIFPGMPQESMGTREHFSRSASGAFRNLQDQDVLHQAAGLQGLPARTMTGAYMPAGGGIAEINPGYALPSEARVTGRGAPNVPQPVQDKMSGLAALRGALTGQEGSTWNVGIPEEGQLSGRLPMEKKASPEQMRAALAREAYNVGPAARPDLIYADTGAGMNVINFGQQLPESEWRSLEGIFNSGKRVETRNVSDYIDYANDWAQQPGSRAVTEKMFANLDKMKPADLARVDQAVRGPAGQLLETYTRAAAKRGQPVRQDFLNLLQTIRDGGLQGARQALNSGAFLPGLVGAVLIPSMFDTPQSEDRSPR